jgi:hypothetical protein
MQAKDHEDKSMIAVVVRGMITPDGKLEVELPADLQPGQVEVEIRQHEVEGVALKDLLESGLVGIWAERTDITDSVEFSRALRRRASRRRVE